MSAFAYYLLKITICSAVLFGYYWFFLRNKVFHSYNRFYLLAGILLSLTLPLFHINIFQTPEQPQTNVIKILQVVSTGDEYMDRVITQAPRTSSFTFSQLLPFFYILISIVFAVALIRMLLRIRSLIKKFPNRSLEYIRFINTDHEKGTPFSFFKNIFWNSEIDIQTPAGNRIFRHELAHIKELHSLDKMFINILLIAFWINPVFWLIRRELNIIHEFIADKRAVEAGDTAALAAMIMAAAYPRHQMSITNPFFFSPIKRRLMMLRKNQNPKVNYISRLLVLPMAVAVFAAFSLKTKTVKAPYILSEKAIVVVIDAGHGGADHGALNIENGTAEKDLNLALAKKIKELNSNKNVHIILTRETDEFTDVKGKAIFANAKNPDLFISIHIDNAPKELWDSATGMEVYVSADNYPNSEKSKLFASAVLADFQKNYGIAVPSIPHQREKGIWVLQAVNHPSVLIEAGYINNKTDYAYLTSDKGQEAFAQNVLNAINDFSASKDFVPASEQIIEPVNDTLGYYKGKAVVSVSAHNNTVTLYYADKTKENISLSEAKKAGLLPPPPPPPPAPNTAIPPVPDAPPAAPPVPPAPPIPPTPPTQFKGYYKEKRVKKVNAFNDGRVVITYPDNTTEIISNAEAKKTGLYPLPGGVQTPIRAVINNDVSVYADTIYFKDKIRSALKDENIKAYQTVYLNSEAQDIINNKIRSHIVQDAAILPIRGNVLAIRNGIPIDSKNIKLDQGDVVNLLPAKNAYTKYGERAADGAIEITTPKPSELGYDPVLRVANFTNPRQPAVRFKNETRLSVTDGYELLSTTVYFSGVGFSNIVVMQINSNDFSVAKAQLEKCVAGSVITFVNVRVKNKNGERTIEGRAYQLY